MDRIGDIADLRCTDLGFYPGFIQLKGKIFFVYHILFLQQRLWVQSIFTGMSFKVLKYTSTLGCSSGEIFHGKVVI